MQRRAPGTLFVKPGESMHDHLDLGPHALLDVIGREFQDGRFTIGQCAAHLPHPAGLNRMHARIQMAVRLGLIVRDGTRKGHGFRHAPHAWEPVRRRLEEC